MKATDKFFDYYDLKQGYTPDEPEGVNRSYEWSVDNELVLNFKSKYNIKIDGWISREPLILDKIYFDSGNI